MKGITPFLAAMLAVSASAASANSFQLNAAARRIVCCLAPWIWGEAGYKRFPALLRVGRRDRER
jgi:hypothetical protein